MTCFTDLGALLGLSYLWSRLHGRQQRRRFERRAALQRLARRWLGRDLVPGPAGEEPEDAACASAWRAVCRYEEAHQKEGCAPPTVDCSVGLPGLSGMLQRAGVVQVEADLEPEELLCADVRPWLRLAPSKASELPKRVGFYQQLLMRPEVFGDPPFFALLAFLCERLDELSSRLAGSSRDCAVQLAKVISAGKEVLGALLPVLLLAICDVMDGTATPLISVESMLASLEAPVSGRLWASDAGRMLRELLQSPHFADFWGCRKGDGARGSLLDMWLELRHAWMDALDAQEQLAEASGIHELFRASGCREVQQSYLDLYKQLDNVIKFLSMVAHYRRLATVAGDAAMYHLRAILHHLLQEIETSMAQVSLLVSRIMREVRRAVMNATSGNAKGAAGGTLLWLSRLQVIDEQALGRSTLALLEALQQLRFLSSEARLPELRKSCQQSLQQICALTASPEFRSRCLEVPPETTLPALEIFAGEEEEAETEPLEEAEAPALLETAPAPSAGAAGPASPASPLPEPKPEAEREAPEARAEVRLGKECDQEEQDRFYELLLAAVLPLLGDGSCLASEEVLFMLGRAGLQAQAQDLMRGKERVEGEELRRILETAARLQDGQENLVEPARRVPWIEGITWDGRRLRIGAAFQG
ncbi:unnamed protein product [Effrenium voratum]|uniref:Uncharacterized protein n=1 Tax=Effrenium voratum TaxID=2562239 RepID=A0AA36N4B8_9DINO|nr:unnamed protein product [Effrenium voratum]